MILQKQNRCVKKSSLYCVELIPYTKSARIKFSKQTNLLFSILTWYREDAWLLRLRLPEHCVCAFSFSNTFITIHNVCLRNHLVISPRKGKGEKLNMITIHLALFITLIVLAIIGLASIALVVSVLVVSKRTETQISNKALEENNDEN